MPRKFDYEIHDIITPDETPLILILGGKAVGKSTLAKLLAGGYSQNGYERCLSLAVDPNGPVACRPIRAVYPDAEDPWGWFQGFMDYGSQQAYKKMSAPFGLILDDATALSTRLIQQVVLQGSWRGDSRGEQPNLKEYGVAIERLRRISQWMRNKSPFQCNIIVSNELYIEDTEREVLMFGPNVVGKNTFAQELPALATHLFYVLPPKQAKRTWDKNTKQWVSQPNTGHRFVLTVPDGSRPAGNRLNTLQEITLDERESIQPGDLVNFRRKIFPGDERENPSVLLDPRTTHSKV